MNPLEIKQRTKAYALRVIRLVEALPRNEVSDVLGRQLLRSGTSVGANDRSACRAKSRRDFIAKMDIVEEECDESIYWMELLADSGQKRPNRLARLMNEGEEILAITVASVNTAMRRGAFGVARQRKSAIRNPQSAME